MTGSVLVDSNLATLLIVGSASRHYVRVHRRCKRFTLDDFDLVGEIIKGFSEIITVPHILAETSNLVRDISGPAYRRIQASFRAFVEGVIELPIASQSGCQRAEFEWLGLADAIMLQVCDLDVSGRGPTLLTTDGKLADRAHALNHDVIDYAREFMTE